MLRAVEDRDASFEGLFWLGVTSTGILCRPGCPARTPKPENQRFFANVSEGLAAGFRPCRRCRPLEAKGETPVWLRPLLAEVEADPTRRWTDAEITATGFSPVRIRRWFQAHHGMTFHAYLRARRLGSALGRIQKGQDLMPAGFDAGYASVSGFRDAFAKLFQATPGKVKGIATPVWVRPLSTPMGMMVAATTEEGLCLLEFHDRRAFETQVQVLHRRLGARFAPGDHPLLRQAESELEEYFDGSRREFSIPLVMPGSPWELDVWSELLKIPCGSTRSYAAIARGLGRPGASRAVGTANGRNRLAIVIPCHRVIRADGSLSGYGGGVWRKHALLDHEAGMRGSSREARG